MKAILEFNLPDDDSEFNLANKGGKYYCALWEMDQWLRSKIKYDDTLTDEQHSTYQKCRDQLRECMFDNDVSFNN
jgi:hypothetical protein